MYEFLIQVQAHYDAEQSMPQRGLYRFAYTITITNAGQIAAQLIARHWFITDGNQAQQEVHGLGVVGRQPLLQPGESFTYSSGCELRTPTGHMQGRYVCVTEEGETFDAPIARFTLDAEHTGDGDSTDPIPQPTSPTLH